MHWSGILIGAISFLVIGIFHPIVIKGEYYFTHKIWPLFLVGGLAFCAASLFVANGVASATLAIVGFSMLWSILELKHQASVEKGWFPRNPKRTPRSEGKGKASQERANAGRPVVPGDLAPEIKEGRRWTWNSKAIQNRPHGTGPRATGGVRLWRGRL